MDAATEARILAELDQLRAGQAEVLALLKRGAKPKPPLRGKPRKVTVKEFCEAEGIGRSQFYRDYARLFTDTRPPEKRVRGGRVRLLEDEVNVFLTDGAAALANFRRRVGRD